MLMKKKTHTMIKRNRIDNHKLAQVVLIRYIVAVPSDYIERTMILFTYEQASLVFTYYFISNVFFDFIAKMEFLF